MMRSLITLAIETAARRSELVSLEWGNVYGNRVRLENTKNDTATVKGRTVPLSSRALAALPPRGTGKVFNVLPGKVSHDFHDVCESQGIEGLRFHDLRHEAVSRLFERGLSVMEVMSISGHKTMSQLHRYTHLSVDNLAAKLG